MIWRASSLSRPGLTSNSTPRPLKIATAAGESLSEMRTRGPWRVLPLTLLPLRETVARRAPDEGSAPLRAVVILECRNRGKRERASRRALFPALLPNGKGELSGRLGELGHLLGEGPVEPLGQRFDVRLLDRRAAPDAQAGRGVAIAADVEGDLLLLERGRRAPWRKPPALRPAAPSRRCRPL